MNEEKINEEIDNGSSDDDSENSGSSNEVNEKNLIMFKSFSRILQSCAYTLAYFTMSVYALNKISHRYFPKLNLNFKWNIYELVKK